MSRRVEKIEPFSKRDHEALLGESSIGFSCLFVIVVKRQSAVLKDF